MTNVKNWNSLLCFMSKEIEMIEFNFYNDEY